MKNPILYTIATALAAVAAIAIVGCDGDFGERSEKMDAFLNRFMGGAETVVKYTITFKANGGNGSPPAPVVVVKDSTTRLPSNSGGLSKTDYEFKGWSEDSSGNFGNYETGDLYTPKSNVTLYARWLPKDVITSKVTVRSEGIGFSGSGEYQNGVRVPINAGTAPAGRRFQEWTASPSVTFASSTSPTTMFVMPAYDVTVTANFVDETVGKYAVTVSSIGVGASGNDSYEAGATVSINAGSDPVDPTGGYRFQNWATENSGVIFGNANSRATTFIMPASAVTVTAIFAAVPVYTVMVTSAGVAGVSGDGSYMEGDEVTIEAGMAPANMRFKEWTVTGEGVTLADSTSATTTFIMPANAVSVTANFRDNKFTVTVSASAGTGATGGGEYFPGTTVSITAGTPPAGFTFKSWMASNDNVVFANANSATTTFIMPSAAVTIGATLSGSGTFTDGRNSKTYKMVAIGADIWMAENLNYAIADGTGSWCYDGNESNCTQYGRLYNWNTAMAGAASSTSNPSGVHGVCPSGWHLPSDAEWSALAIVAGGTGTYGDGGTAGKKLKSTSGWNSNGNGTDDYGFSALPGGYRNSDGYFDVAGYNGDWWTATEYDASRAYGRLMHDNNEHVYRGWDRKSDGYAVRCVRD
jgi:uncharacterized protein (TIGR02145 family)/uncharacterized repeat protein (TIGR02543 family)